MSLILEALRKSEAERRRGEAPNVAVELSPPVTPRHRTSAWLWPALIVLVLVLALAAWWTQRKDSPDTEGVVDARPITSEPATTSQSSAPAIVARIPERMSSAPVAPPPVATSTPVPATPAPAAARPAVPAPPIAYDEPSVLDIPAPPPSRPASPAPQPAVLPPSTGMSGVKLSMHLWNDAPSRRFVVLNGQRMTEGDRNGDLVLVEILRDGVIVERAGERARVNLP